MPKAFQAEQIYSDNKIEYQIRLAIATLDWTAHDRIWNISRLTCADTFPEIKDGATQISFFCGGGAE